MKPKEAIIPQKDPSTTSHARRPPSGNMCVTFFSTTGMSLLSEAETLGKYEVWEVDWYGDSALPGSSTGPGVRTENSAVMSNGVMGLEIG
jgi:hypothetical protein